MNRAAVAILGLLIATSAQADEKPSADEMQKLTAALKEFGCSGGEMEKETEASGIFEVDDAKCKGGQYDLKFDKNFELISITRD